jgi:hypothetical protein
LPLLLLSLPQLTHQRVQKIHAAAMEQLRKQQLACEAAGKTKRA